MKPYFRTFTTATIILCFQLFNIDLHAQQRIFSKSDSVNLNAAAHFAPLKNLPSSFGKMNKTIPVNARVQPYKIISNTVCRDSSNRDLYLEDSLSVGCNSISPTADGNFIAAGYRIVSYNPVYRMVGYVMKFTPAGDTLWIKNIEGSQGRIAYYRTACELNNGDILLVGEIYVPVLINTRRDMLLTRLTSTGNFVWQKTLVHPSSSLDYVEFENQVYDIKSTASGDIYLCGGVVGGGFSRYGLAAKLTSSGDVVWSRAMPMSGYIEFIGLNIINNQVQVYGNSSDNVKVEVNFDAATGDTLSTNKWNQTANPNLFKGFRAFGITKLDNGNTVMSGRCVSDFYSPDPNDYGHGGILEITPNFTVADAYRVVNNRFGVYDLTKTTAEKNGALTVLTYYGDGTDEFVGITKVVNKQVIKDRAINYHNQGFYLLSNSLPLPNGADIFVASTGPDYTRIGVEIVKAQQLDTTGGCMGNDVPLSTIDQVEYVPVYAAFGPTETAVMIPEPGHADYLPFSDGPVLYDDCKQTNFL